MPVWFRQIGEILLAGQKALILRDLTIGFRDRGIGFAQPLFQGFDIGQERPPISIGCLKLQYLQLNHTLFGCRPLKPG